MSNWSNPAKHAATMVSEFKGSGPWYYDQIGYTYDQVRDPVNNDQVQYDHVGIGSSFTNTQKNASSFNNATKH